VTPRKKECLGCLRTETPGQIRKKAVDESRQNSAGSERESKHEKREAAVDTRDKWGDAVPLEHSKPHSLGRKRGAGKKGERARTERAHKNRERGKAKSGWKISGTSTRLRKVYETWEN